MKALILSIKAGYGHHSTAHAMIDCFKEHGIDCEMLDTFAYINKHLCEGIQDGYLLTTKYLKEAYGKVYSQLDKKDEPYDRYSPTALISKLISKRLVKYILDYAPDFIIGTHSYAAVLMSILRNDYRIDCPMIGIITDFTVHPFWESTQLDYYVLPNDLLTMNALKKGIGREKLLPTGIPIRKEFSIRHDRHLIREKLGLQDKTTVLVMMGSMGFGNMEHVIRGLNDYPQDFQIVTICGNNKKAKAQIDDEIWNKNIINLGFTTNVDEYMDAADLIVTKPGGLTSSEALAKHLPMVLMNPIPGQEDRNMQFLTNTGGAVAVTSTFPIENALYQILECDWRRESMLNSISHIAKPNAAEDLYQFIAKILELDPQTDRINHQALTTAEN